MQKLAWQKILLRIVSFVLILLLCIALTGQYLMPHSNRYLTGFTAGGILGEDYDTIDVVVMGDSNAADAVAPMDWYDQYGITGYTYGVGWFTVFKAYYRLRTIFEEQSPKVVVLCTGMVYSKKSHESYLSNMVWDVTGELLPLFRFHENWKYLNFKNLTEAHDYSWRDVNRGYAINTNQIPYTGGEYMTDTATAEFPIGVELYMDKIRALCEEHGTKLVLITVPAATSWNMARHNGVNAYAEDRGLEYIDFNADITSLGLDWNTDTADAGDHLNLWGAKKVTTKLGDYLHKHFRLDDHRGQKGYEDWDQDAQEYRQNIAKAQEQVTTK
jgi:hypothetical protein